MSRFINPYTDFGFKKLFGEEANKDLLIDFLNAFLPEKHQVETLEFRNPEYLGISAHERRAVFDVFCEAKSGEKFIVEMQKEDQEFFKDRSLYYSAYPILEQGQKGQKWNFELKTVYFIGILDFIYDKNELVPVLIREVSLKDQFGMEFNGKLQYIFIQMPVFKLDESELVTPKDKWLYFLKNLPDLDYIPSILKEDDVFRKAFHTAEVAAMPKNERFQYEHERLDYLTYWATIDTAEKRGMEKGMEKGKTEIARNMLQKGLDVSLIEEITGLSQEEIKSLD